MLGISYRGLRNGQPTLVLHSRVSYVAYIGGLDLGLCHVLAKEIGQKIRVPVSEFAFEWHADALQFHGFKSLPLLYQQKYIKDLENPQMREEYPTIKLVGRWWDKIVADTENGKPLEAERYGPLKRVRRRYTEYINEDFLPSVPLSTLSLEALYR